MSGIFVYVGIILTVEAAALRVLTQSYVFKEVKEGYCEYLESFVPGQS